MAGLHRNNGRAKQSCSLLRGPIKDPCMWTIKTSSEPPPKYKSQLEIWTLHDCQIFEVQVSADGTESLSLQRVWFTFRGALTKVPSHCVAADPCCSPIASFSLIGLCRFLQHRSSQTIPPPPLWCFCFHVAIIS